MPKFYFEIVDGYTIEDPQGMELPTEQQAKRIAEEMAKQIANDVEDGSLKDVVVKTAAGKVIHKTPIKSDSTRNGRGKIQPTPTVIAWTCW